MRCPSCTAENAQAARFCQECGTRLPTGCPRCGHDVAPTAKFCQECGQQLGDRSVSAPTAPSSSAAPESYTPRHLAAKILASRQALTGERKQITVLFADIVGSTELIRDRDPEDAQRLLDGAVQRMMAAVHQYEGTVSRLQGDGLMAMFGAPLALEDHAVRACYAALAMLEAVRAYADEARRTHDAQIAIRVGLNSGEVIVRLISDDLHMDYTAMGQTVHLASRMEGLAQPGSGVLSPSTLALVEGFVEVRALGPKAVRGLDEPVDVFELLGAGAMRTRLEVSAARGLTRFVGREHELGIVQTALQAASAGYGQVVALVGEPGVGKSRLVHEAIQHAIDGGWLVLRCGAASYGKSTPYLPLIDLLKGYAGIEPGNDPATIRAKLTGRLRSLDEALEPSVSALLALLDALSTDDPRHVAWAALDPPRRRRATLDALERLLLRESQTQPLLLVVEDLHWIDSESEALLDRLVEALPTARLLLLINYRPEYTHSWSTRRAYTQVRIDPLTSSGAGDMLRSLLGPDQALDTLKERLTDQTRGNPFFLEECVRSLIETEALIGQRGALRLAHDLPDLRVPPTVQAILASRIDRLEPEEKRILQTAAVIGKDLAFSLLRAIAELPDERLHDALSRLQASELLFPTSFYPEPEYTFVHALTHDVAYGSLLQERRRDLHGRIVSAIERQYVDRLDEHVERLAHHANAAESWVQTTEYRRQAGRRAMARSAHREAVQHLEDAVAALDRLSVTPERRAQAIDLRFELRAALRLSGDDASGLQRLWEAEALAEALGDRRRLAWAEAHLAATLWMTGSYDRAIEIAQRSAAIADALGDAPVQNMAYNGIALPLWGLGRYRESVEYFRLALGFLPQDQLAVRSAESTHTGGIQTLVNLAWALAEIGEFDEAREYERQAIHEASISGSPFMQASVHIRISSVALLRGDVERIIGNLERTLHYCRTQEQRFALPFVLGKLGGAYVIAGRVREAQTLLEEAVAHARSGHAPAEGAQWLAALAEAYLLDNRPADAKHLAQEAFDGAVQRGERGNEAWIRRLFGQIAANGEPPDFDEAERQYRAALALADELGMRPLAAHCHLGLGRMYGNTGRTNLARDELAAALALFRAMEMNLWASEAEGELTTIGALAP
jgi:class 3 adenylate cyclase/tetratricopeptide (TPR) repeat protein